MKPANSKMLHGILCSDLCVGSPEWSRQNQKLWIQDCLGFKLQPLCFMLWNLPSLTVEHDIKTVSNPHPLVVPGLKWVLPVRA